MRIRIISSSTVPDPRHFFCDGDGAYWMSKCSDEDLVRPVVGVKGEEIFGDESGWVGMKDIVSRSRGLGEEGIEREEVDVLDELVGGQLISEEGVRRERSSEVCREGMNHFSGEVKKTCPRALRPHSGHFKQFKAESCNFEKDAGPEHGVMSVEILAVLSTHIWFRFPGSGPSVHFRLKHF